MFGGGGNLVQIEGHTRLKRNRVQGSAGGNNLLCVRVSTEMKALLLGKQTDQREGGQSTQKSREVRSKIRRET